MRAQITISSLIICSCFLHGFASSCVPAADPDLTYNEISLIPGECLIDNNLQCIYSNSHRHGDEYLFRFAVNVDTEYEVIKSGVYFISTYPIIHRHRPSDSFFNKFGNNSKKIKTEYDRIWQELDISQSTLFYQEGISLTADKEFAGIPAGENLAQLITTITNGDRYHWEQSKHFYISPFDIDKDNMLALYTSRVYYIYGQSNNMDDYFADDLIIKDVEKRAFFDLIIPAQDCSFVPETVQFKLEVPIKSAQYLNWLNDKLTNENAAMTWKDEVLTCSFSSHVCLKKK